MRQVFFFLVVLLAAISVYATEVDISGNLNHTIKIEVPPGTMGIAPRLSITYNSAANSPSDNGMLGLGFRLNGLPSIKRDVFLNYIHGGK